jgi:EAL domain-containing protein (putative c-di-GMP-specific phosphodiesterase class I)
VERVLSRENEMAQAGCKELCAPSAFDAPFAMAFQPIVDARGGWVHAYEALVRGPEGQGASSVLQRVNAANSHAFDQASRIKAIETAARLGLAAGQALLSINFMPNAVQDPKTCTRATVSAAQRAGLPLDRLIFEFTEGEPVEYGHLSRILATYKALGLKTAIDDFGAGYSGLSLLAKFQPDLVKLDMELIRDIDSHRVKQVLVSAMVKACVEIGVEVVAEGIETHAESATLRDMGVDLQQGFLFARPGFESLPEPTWPKRQASKAIAA